MTTATTLIRLALAVPVLLIGAGLAADPAAPVPPVPVIRHTYRVDRLPYSTYGQRNWINPGSNIPPCEMVFGYTDRGPTDQDGHLLQQRVYAPPQWTFITAPVKTQRQ